MDAAFVLYDRMTALDLVGPYEMLAGQPEVTPHFVAARRGPVTCDSGLVINAGVAFEELSQADLVMVPGSGYWHVALDDNALIDWLGAVCPTATWVTSVCTGSTLLAKAGVLEGRTATTHWLAREILASFGATVSTDRVVIDGNVVTGAGVSAGLDMALTLVAEIWGEERAQMVQLVTEYDPQPPFDAGSPEKAPPQVVTLVQELLVRQVADG